MEETQALTKLKVRTLNEVRGTSHSTTEGATIQRPIPVVSLGKLQKAWLEMASLEFGLWCLRDVNTLI